MWYGIAIGGVVGGESQGDGGLGGAKNFNSDEDSNNGGQGLFSIGGHQVWLYLGGMIGFGDSIGLYFTAGPMLGANSDLAIGGGIHIGKAIGVGVVVPVFQTIHAMGRHSDKLTAYNDIAQRYVSNAQGYISDALAQLPTISSGLERVVNMLS